MNGMKGEFTGFSNFLMTASIFVVFAPFPFIVLLHITNSTVKLVLVLLSMFLSASGMILACYAPCRFEAGDRGFMISVFGVKFVYKYSEIENIGCEYENTRCGGMIKLIVKDNGGGVTEFCEMCNADDMTALLNDPNAKEKPQLVKLCDYVNLAKGAEI
ncbi:MAG: hypothetical protein K6B74_10365 [Ruminococcus sp.]|nr:hypothetical protein [Ruminococcus sp.]